MIIKTALDKTIDNLELFKKLLNFIDPIVKENNA